MKGEVCPKVCDEGVLLNRHLQWASSSIPYLIKHSGTWFCFHHVKNKSKTPTLLGPLMVLFLTCMMKAEPASKTCNK